MAKRGNGEGTITKRHDGRYEARIVYAGKRRCFYGRTRAEVEAKMTAAKRDRDLGLPAADDQVTVGQYLDQWLENDARPTIRPGTYKSYASHVRLYLKPALGALRLTRLSPRHIQAMQTDLLARGLSPTTVQRVRATLRRALGRGMKMGVVNRNAAALTDAPRSTRQQVRALSPDEARELLAAFKDHQLEAAVTIALATGLRQGEQLGLKWADLDLDGSTLTVRQSLQRIDGQLRLVEPKTARSLRTLHLPSVAVAILRTHRAAQNRGKLVSGDRWQESGFVFTTDRGGPLDGTVVTHSFQRQLRQAQLPVMRWHDLRHACASLMIALGTSPRYVQEQLGHSGITITMNTYAHVLPAGMKDAAERLGDVLSGAS
jgi:integrase